jgi:hypothetical protein
MKKSSGFLFLTHPKTGQDAHHDGLPKRENIELAKRRWSHQISIQLNCEVQRELQSPGKLNFARLRQQDMEN